MTLRLSGTLTDRKEGKTVVIKVDIVRKTGKTSEEAIENLVQSLQIYLDKGWELRGGVSVTSISDGGFLALHTIVRLEQ